MCNEQEVAANCPDFSDYANLIGINTSCKMRWTGQWPTTVSGQSVGISAQTFCEEPITTSHVIVSAAAAAAQQAQQQRTGNVSGQPMTTGGCAMDGSLMSIDHQLHHQIQKQLCIDQFELLSQLQVINTFV